MRIQVPDNHTPGKAATRALLGYLLRHLRERKGVSSEDAALEAGVARATLWRMEKGDNRCRYKPGDVELLGRLYGADRTMLELLTHLAKKTRVAGWLDEFRDVLTDAGETYLDLEAYAVKVRCYANAVVPDLLQVTDYATALATSSRSMGPSQARRLIQLWTCRQQLLTRDPQPAEFEFLIDESALHRGIGQPSVMHALLRSLSDRAELPNVSMRVVPYRAGLYPGLGIGAFTLLDFPTHEPFGADQVPAGEPTFEDKPFGGDKAFGGLPARVYRPGESTLLDDRANTNTYDDHWNDIRAHALDPYATLRLITDTADHSADNHIAAAPWLHSGSESV
jgi:transcriptional regulator with XRE-family HTH domain